LACKPFFWLVPRSNVTFIGKEPGGASPYLIDDTLFNQQLRSQGLDINSEGATSQFVFYHMNGTHTPFITDENTNSIPMQNGTATKSLRGCFNYMYYYFDQLKSMGKYEDSTIIILSDHGNRRAVTYQRTAPTVPICFVKPAGAAGTPYKTSSAPLVTENVRATILKDIGIPLKEGQVDCLSVPEDLDIARPVVCRWKNNVSSANYVTTFEVRGDANDWSNWHLLEEKPTGYWTG
jgi:hypothetical protein